MFTLKDVFFAFTLIGILILIGRLIQQQVRWIQQLYLPESVVAGVLALLLGPEVLGAIVSYFGGDNVILAQGLFSEPIRAVWQQAPSVFINIVFAALFLGETIPKPQEIWRKAAPQVIFGQSLAWGQYVIGISLTLLILAPFFNINPIAGALIEIAFEGGHGTAAGMQDTFVNLNFPQGRDLALGLATIGIISGIVAGTFLSNWGRKKGYIQTFQTEGQHLPEYEGILGEATPESDTETMRLKRAQLMENLLIDPLSLNFGFVGLAVTIGWLILEALVGIESLTWGKTGVELMVYVPLFPMTLVGGDYRSINLAKIRAECAHYSSSDG